MRWGRAIGLALVAILAAARIPRAACADGAEVPRAPLSEAAVRILRPAVEAASREALKSSPWEKDLPQHELEAFDRLARVPLPDVTRLERVRVVTPGKDPIEGRAWRVPGAGPPWTLVLSDFTVVTVDAKRVATVEAAPYPEELKGLLTPEGEPAAEERRSDSIRFGWAMRGDDERGPRLLPHAITAAVLGDDAQAKALVAAALKYHERIRELYEAGAKASFRVGAAALRSGAPWRDVLRAWSDTATTWPESEAGAVAQECVSVLVSEVPEMEALAAAPPLPAAAPVADSVAWHAARLAERRHPEEFLLGVPPTARSVFDPERALVDIGAPAIPELVARLSDRRLTRGFHFDRMHGIGSFFTVVRVQDLALACLQVITALRFGNVHDLCEARPEDRARVIEDVTRWWAENGSKGRSEQIAARLFMGEYDARLQALRLLERIAPTSVDARAVLRRWAVEMDSRLLPDVASEAAKRGDLSLLPAVRGMEHWYGGDHASPFRVLLDYGDASDVLAIREVLRRSLSQPEDEFARSRTSTILRGAMTSKRPILVPLLVDVLDLRSPWPDGGSSDPKTPADGAMEALVKATGHDEGWRADPLTPERFAAIDRWIAWWRSEGRAAYLAAHPEVEAADPRGGAGSPGLALTDLPPMVEVEQPNAAVRIVHDVPRGVVVTLLQGGDILATRGVGVPGKEWRLTFASEAAAVRWFDAARPVPAAAPTDARPVVEHLEGFPREGDGLLLDPEGVPWIWTSEQGGGNSGWRAAVEAGARAGPRPPCVVVGHMRRLFLDRHGVLWLAPAWDDRALVGYDLKQHAWLEPALVDEHGALAQSRKDDLGSLRTIRGACETRDGRLLFADGWGVHSLANGVWTYSRLIPPSEPGADLPKTLADAQFVEDAAGRVWLWSRWMDGAGGAFRLDGNTWTRVVAADVRIETLVPAGGDDAWIFGPNGDCSRLHDSKVETGDEVRRTLHPNVRFRHARVVARAKDGGAYVLLDDTTVLEPFRKGAWWALFLPVGGPVQELGHSPATALLRFVGEHDVVPGPDGWIWGRDGAGTLCGMSPEGDLARTIPSTRALGLNRLVGLDGRGNAYAWGLAGLWRVRTDEAAGSNAPAGALLPAIRVSVARAWPDTTGRPCCTFGEHQASLAFVDGAKITLRDPPPDHEGRSPSRINEARAGADGAMVLVDDTGHVHLVDAAGWTVAASMPALLEGAGKRLRAALAVPPARVARNASFHAAIDDCGVLWFASGRGAWGAVADGRTILGREAGFPVGSGTRFIEVLEPVGNGRVFVRDEENDAGILEAKEGRIVSTVPFETGRSYAGGIHPFDVAMRERGGRLRVVFGRGAGTVGPAGVKTDEPVRSMTWFLAEDRLGGRWGYENGARRALVRRTADGREARLVLEQGPEMLTVAESPDGSMWTWEIGALVRIAAVDGELSAVERYPMRTGIVALWCDALGRLWIFGDDQHGLGRQLTGFAMAPGAPPRPK